MAKAKNPIKDQLKATLEKQSDGNTIKSLDYKSKDPNNEGRGGGVYVKWAKTRDPSRWLYLGSSYPDALANAQNKAHNSAKIKN